MVSAAMRNLKKVKKVRERGKSGCMADRLGSKREVEQARAFLSVYSATLLGLQGYRGDNRRLEKSVCSSFHR